MSTATAPQTLEKYLESISQAAPAEALKIAMAETERIKAEADLARAEYRAMSELEFDEQGRIKRANMNGMYRLANIYARSGIVPEHYQGKPDACYVGIDMAFRLKVHPLAYMQSSFVHKGKPGIDAKFAVAMLNTSGKIRGRIRYVYKGTGDSRECTAVATDADSGEEVSCKIDWATVKAEGWDKDKGTQISKWQTMPEQMFHYRSAAWLIRRHYPEVLMGLYTKDELEDIVDDDALPRPSGTVDEIAASLAGKSVDPPAGNGHTAAPTGPVSPQDLTSPQLAADQTQRDAEPEHKPAADAEADDKPDPLQGIPEAMAAATTIGEVKQVADVVRPRLTDARDKGRLNQLERDNVERIRGSRSEKSNAGTQQQLV